MVHEELPLQWKKSLLAISPGLLATAGLITTDFSFRMFVGMLILVAYQVSVYWWNKRHLPGWSLMGVGMLISTGLVILSGVLGGLGAIIIGKLANVFVLFILLTLLIILLGIALRGRRLSPLVWLLISLIILCQLAVRVKYFVQFGVSWSVAGQWLNISLYAVVIALLLPVAFGLVLAKRYCLFAMLFVIGMIYASFQILIDVNYKVSDQIGGDTAFVVYKAWIPFLFTVAAPLWFLRARTSIQRICGLLILVGLAVILDLLIVGCSYGGELDRIIWISFIPYTGSVLLTLSVAYLLYRDHK